MKKGRPYETTRAHVNGLGPIDFYRAQRAGINHLISPKRVSPMKADEVMRSTELALPNAASCYWPAIKKEDAEHPEQWPNVNVTTVHLVSYLEAPHDTEYRRPFRPELWAGRATEDEIGTGWGVTIGKMERCWVRINPTRLQWPEQSCLPSIVDVLCLKWSPDAWQIACYDPGQVHIVLHHCHNRQNKPIGQIKDPAGFIMASAQAIERQL